LGPIFYFAHYSVFNDRCAKAADQKSGSASVVAESGKLVDPTHPVNPIFYFFFTSRQKHPIPSTYLPRTSSLFSGKTTPEKNQAGKKRYSACRST
jgi:hypothetical protein